MTDEEKKNGVGVGDAVVGAAAIGGGTYASYKTVQLGAKATKAVAGYTIGKAAGVARGAFDAAHDGWDPSGAATRATARAEAEAAAKLAAEEAKAAAKAARQANPGLLRRGLNNVKNLVSGSSSKVAEVATREMAEEGATRAFSGVLGKVPGVNFVAKGLGKVPVLGTFVTVAIEAPTIVAGVKEGDELGARKAAKATTRLGGMLAGMAAGAGVGVWAGGIGAIPGAIAGGVTGWLGAKGGEMAYDAITGETDVQAAARYNKETRLAKWGGYHDEFKGITERLEAVHMLPDADPTRTAKIAELEKDLHQNVKVYTDFLNKARNDDLITAEEYVDANANLHKGIDSVDHATMAAVRAQKTHESMMEKRHDLYASLTDEFRGQGKGDGVVTADEQKVFDRIVANNGNVVAADDIKANITHGIRTGDVALEDDGKIHIKANTQGFEDIVVKRDEFQHIIDDLSRAMNGQGAADVATMGQKAEVAQGINA